MGKDNVEIKGIFLIFAQALSSYSVNEDTKDFLLSYLRIFVATSLEVPSEI